MSGVSSAATTDISVLTPSAPHTTASPCTHGILLYFKERIHPPNRMMPPHRNDGCHLLGKRGVFVQVVFCSIPRAWHTYLRTLGLIEAKKNEINGTASSDLSGDDSVSIFFFSFWIFTLDCTDDVLLFFYFIAVCRHLAHGKHPQHTHALASVLHVFACEHCVSFAFNFFFLFY